MNDWVLVILVMLGEGFLHYFPWRAVLRGHELPRPAAYVLGVAGLMLPFTIWLYERGELIVIGRLWAVIVAGGIAVLALYGLDSIYALWWREQEATEEVMARRQDAAQSNPGA